MIRLLVARPTHSSGDVQRRAENVWFEDALVMMSPVREPVKCRSCCQRILNFFDFQIKYRDSDLPHKPFLMYKVQYPVNSRGFLTSKFSSSKERLASFFSCDLCLKEER